MFRQLSAITLGVLTTIGGIHLTIAQEFKEAGRNTPPPPKDLVFDLGKGVKLEMLLIPSGEFMMGAPNSDHDASNGERPQHRVRITKPFYLGKYLVTQEQWQAVMGDNQSRFKGPRNPVDDATWLVCEKFLEKLSRKVRTEGGKFVLPTEAQWEYACRAGSKTKYYFGDDKARLGDYAWYRENLVDGTHPVGMKKPNAWGLYDMYGSVGEICRDWYDDRYYATSPVDDPMGPTTGSYETDSDAGNGPGPSFTHRRVRTTGSFRVLRGGNWAVSASECRSAFRYGWLLGAKVGVQGLRVCYEPVEKQNLEK